MSLSLWDCTTATCAVSCWDVELFGDDAPELLVIADTVIGASSIESDWSIGTTPITDTPSGVVLVWRINFFWKYKVFMQLTC